jgi:ribose 5-phosphate isomerase B
MKIYLASDHAGFKLKEKIKIFLVSQNYEVKDCGSYQIDKNDDYPDFIAKAAEKVSDDPLSKGVVLGKSGAGEEIVANKFKNVRAILGFSKENVILARKDNDVNILSLGAAFVDENKALELVKLFLETPFSSEQRHKRRIKEISDLE